MAFANICLDRGFTSKCPEILHHNTPYGVFAGFSNYFYKCAANLIIMGMFLGTSAKAPDKKGILKTANISLRTTTPICHIGPIPHKHWHSQWHSHKASVTLTDIQA
jgi:hypothetical protein